MKIHITGAGRNIIVIPGWGMHHKAMTPILSDLAQHCRLHIVDLPGYGNSKESTLEWAPDTIVKYIADHVPSAVWLGWSMGGLLTIHAAAMGFAQAAVLIATTAQFVTDIDAPLGITEQTYANFHQRLDKSVPDTLRRFYNLCVCGSPTANADRRQLDALLSQNEHPTKEALKKGLELLKDLNLYSELPRITIPTLWIGGEHDHIVPKQAVERAARLVSNAQVHIAKHTSHIPFLKKSAQVLPLIRQFISISI